MALLASQHSWDPETLRGMGRGQPAYVNLDLALQMRWLPAKGQN